MKKKAIWKNGILVTACILLNILGRLLADACKLPVWLDMIGTCIAAYFAGPVGGVIAGAANNLLWGILDSSALAYTATSVVAALAIWYCVRKQYFETLSGAMVSSFWMGILCMVVSTPLNLWLQNGYSGNLWGDALFDMLDWYGVNHILCAVACEGIVEIVDKQICVLLAFGMIRLLQKYGLGRYSGKAAEAKPAAAGLLSLILLGDALLLLAGAAGGQPALRVQAAEGELPGADNFIPQIYNNSNGMMSSEANVIAETEDGYIWIGSYAGLTRYDGSVFEFIRDGGITSVTALLTDSEGRLWIGTNDKGVVRYENGTFTFFTVEDGLPANSVRCFAQSGDGSIYVGTTDKICKIDENDAVCVVERDFNYVISLEYYEGLIVGVDNNGQLFSLNIDDSEAGVDGELRDLFCKCVRATTRGLLLGTRDNQLLVLSVENGGVVLQNRLTASLEDVVAIDEDQDGRIWLCAEAGLGYFDETGAFHRQHCDGFDYSLEGIHADYQGNIWVTSSRYGVMKLSESRFVDLFTPAGIPNVVVNGVVPYDGCFYCGTDGGLIALDRETFRTRENALTGRLNGVRVRSVITDSQNRLWACTYGSGVVCYDAKTDSLTSYTVEGSGLTTDWTRCAVELPDQTIVIGTSDGINFIRDGKVTGTITGGDGLSNAQILSMMVTAEGRLYAGSDGGGLYVVENQRITDNYTVQDGLPSGVILRIVPYQDGYFLVTSNSLCWMQEGDFRVLESFPYFNNYDIVLDDTTAYVLSSAGIYVVNADRLRQDDASRCELYSVADGLRSGLVANSWSFLGEDKTLYLCCNTGVIGFGQELDTKELAYKYGITSVVCDGEIISDEDHVFDIPRNAKRISVTASIRNYALTNIHTRFFIEDVENRVTAYSDSELGTMQIANLPSGRYQMHVQLLDSEGQVLEEQLYYLNKEMQFFEHRWYRIYLMIVSVEIIVFATWSVLILVDNNRKKEALERLRLELEKKVSEQTEEIRKQQQRIQDLFVRTVLALSEAVDAKDRYTGGHSKRVAEYARMLAARLGKTQEEQEVIYRAGLLHDIGKIRIPEEIINKTSKLTPDEFELIKVHPVIGYHILKAISDDDRQIALGAKFHHERYDGQGYPNALKGEDIPEVARILGVADAYDAMASNRSYRKALDQQIIRAEIEKGAGTQFDPRVAQIMLRIIDEDTEYRLKQTDELTRRILVVDDVPGDIEIVRTIMQDEPMYRIVGAESGEEALEMIRADHMDMVLLDIQMPGMDGFETYERIKELTDVPVVFMTADKDSATIERMAATGAADYFTKPFLPMTIKEIFHSLV